MGWVVAADGGKPVIVTNSTRARDGETVAL